MLFLIEYDRRRGQIVTFRSFADSKRSEAESARLELELTRHRQRRDREIVLLQARSEKALRITHRRYFQTVRQIIEASA